MEISIDITKSFNGLIDYVNMEVKPIIFLNFPSDIRGKYCFELMNFRLNMDSKVLEQLKEYSPVCKDIVDCGFLDKSIFIFGKAKFIIDGVNGADVEFATEDDFFNGKKVYHTWDYKIEAGDYAYVCGGYSSFIPWFTTIYLLTHKINNAKVTFSSDEYVLMDTYDDTFAKSKETTYNYTNNKGKLFNFQFLNKFFPTEKSSKLNED